MDLKTQQAAFKNDYYAVVNNALSRELCDFGVEYMYLFAKAGHMANGDIQVSKSKTGYSVPFCETVLARMTDVIGAIAGRKLYPAYSYTRIYYPGAELKPHKDRPSCEVSATLTLGYSTDKPWSIFARHPETNQRTELSLKPGEMMVYQGVELEHWRERWQAPENSWQIQVFLHYVYADGPHQSLKYDRRKHLCTRPIAPNQKS